MPARRTSSRVVASHGWLPARDRPLMAPEQPPIRWGIASTGKVAQDFARDLALVPDARAVAVASRTRESAEAFEYATAKLSAGSRFTNHTRQGNLYSMVDRKQELVVVRQTERYIVIVIGHDEEKVKTTSERLVEKLKGA